jgi:hypothetical protein
LKKLLEAETVAEKNLVKNQTEEETEREEKNLLTKNLVNLVKNQINLLKVKKIKKQEK